MTRLSFQMAVMLLVFGFCALARAGMEVIARETFEGVKTLDSAHPGGLGAWDMGAWHCRPVGPRLPGVAAPGWSGDAQGEMTRTHWDLAAAPFSSARAHGMMGCWVRFAELRTAGYYGSANSANPAIVLQLHSGADNAPVQTIGVTNTGRMLSRTAGSDWVVAVEPVKPNTWYWVQIEWTTSPTAFVASASCQVQGGQLAELSRQTVNVANYQASKAYVMNAPSYVAEGQHYMWRGRMGAVVLAKIDSLGDGRQMPDVLPPVEARHVWHLNPASGDDTNDGLTPETAWKTAFKLNQENTSAGILSPAAGGYSQGDILIIDTTAQPLDIGSQVLEIRTPGLTVRPPEGVSAIRIQAHKDISAPNTLWERVPGSDSRVWRTADGGSLDLTETVIWENDLWLNHPTGANVNAVMGALQSTPGSFFSDGVHLYLHPFGSTNPNQDGKTYVRSRFRTEGRSAVMLTAPDLCIQGLDVRKTALARAVDNDPYTSYGIQGEQEFGGVTLLQNCHVEYAGKHCIGFTDSGSSRDVTVEACQVEQGTPYSNQTPWVDYNGIETASGNRTTYIDCINLRPSGKIGSTEGTVEYTTSYYAHNNGVGAQFDSIRFIGGVYAGQFATGGGIRSMSFEGTTLGGGNVSVNELSLTRCVMTQIPLGNGAPQGLLTARHNIIRSTDGILNGSSNAVVMGKAVFEGNTFDLRTFVRSDNGMFSLFRRGGDLDFTFQNNIVIGPADRSFNVLEHGRSTDTLLFTHNLYQTGPAKIVVHFFNDGSTVGPRTFQQWQALGYDGGSQVVSDLKMDVSYVPAPDSPASQRGADLGMEPDFSGRLFEHRNSIGAMEPAESFPEWQERYFSEEERENELVGGPEADVDQDGISNLMEFALGQDPLRPGLMPDWKPGWQRAGDGRIFLNMRVRYSHVFGARSWKAQVSNDLEKWLEVPDLQSEVISSASLPDEWGILEYHLPVPLSFGPQAFMRLVPVPAGE